MTRSEREEKAMRLQKLLSKLTPGEWSVDAGSEGQVYNILSDGSRKCVVSATYLGDLEITPEDAEFIVLAHEFMPDLLRAFWLAQAFLLAAQP